MAVDIASFQFEAARLFCEEYLPGIRSAITGSLGLVLHGFNLSRECSDIDLLVESVPEKIPEGWVKVPLPKEFTYDIYKAKTTNDDYEFEVHIIVAGWGFSTVKIQGVDVAPFIDIIDAKLDFGMTGTLKHMKDFHEMLTQLYQEILPKFSSKGKNAWYE